MKDRLAELSSPMALPIHPHLVYPKQSALAGQPLRAVGVVGGRPVWPVLGGAPEGDSNGGAGTGEGDEGSDGSGGSEGADDASKNQSDKGADGNVEARLKALEEEKNRHYTRRQEAETENASLKAKLKEIEDKDKSELERATESAKELNTKVEQLESTNQDLMLQVAFLSDNTYTWQNPKRALQLADLSSVEFKDGKATGLDKALEALAKSDPYLLKQEDKEKDEQQGGQTGKTHNGKKANKSNVDMVALKQKYPALRGR